MRQYSAKATYNLIDPTDRSHSIAQTEGDVHIFAYRSVLQYAAVCCSAQWGMQIAWTQQDIT